MQSIPTPTSDELTKFSISAFKGIEAGLGHADPVAIIAQKLEEKYAGHLILVQSGNFLHGYDRTAYALATLKKYKLKLVGASTEPHIRIGFPVGNFKRRLWSIAERRDDIAAQAFDMVKNDSALINQDDGLFKGNSWCWL